MFSAKQMFTILGWRQTQKLLAGDLGTGDQFGYSVSISGDGNTAIIGAYQESTLPYTRNGAAYVFTWDGTTWTQVAKLLAGDLASNDGFGQSVSISDDGNTALVGAYNESTSPDTNNGAVYVFTRSGSTWTEQAKLLASDRAGNDLFGWSVAISADGNTAIIGARNQDTSPDTNNGAAYVFTRSGTTWTEEAKLLASDRASSDFFGESVSISDDGNTVIVGAYGKDLGRGAAYVFTWDGSTWTEEAKLLASDRATSDWFGWSVSLSADGNTALIGAPGEDTSPYTNNGAAYVFTRSGSTWTEQAKLTASDLASNDQFGGSVSLSGDGNTALIGAYPEDTTPYTDNGAAYVFTRTGSTWPQVAKLLAGDRATNDYFGRSVSLSSDGNTALIGASQEDTSPYTNNGAAYVFVNN